MQAQGFIRQNNAASGFTVNDTFVPSTNSDLNIQANISDFAPIRPASCQAFVKGFCRTTTTQHRIRSSRISSIPAWASMATPTPTRATNRESANVTWVYTGEFFDADGVVTFAAKLNAVWQLIIDGYAVSRLRLGDNGLFYATHVLTLGPGNGGWHTFEFRTSNDGNDNAGVQGGWPFVFNPGGTSYSTVNTVNTGLIQPMDNGNQNLFRVPSTSNPYTLNKLGTGTLTLTGPSTYSGGTQIQAGNVVLGPQVRLFRPVRSTTSRRKMKCSSSSSSGSMMSARARTRSAAARSPSP